MNRQLKRMTVASSVALAFCLPASSFATQGVFFDPDGGGATFGAQLVDTFDWGAGHVLYSNCFGAGGLGAGSGCTIFAQGPIATISGDSGNIAFPGGFTFVLQVKAKSSDESGGGTYDGATVTSGQSITFKDLLAAGYGDATSYFKIYANTGVVDPLLGTGYTAGTEILSGRIKINTFAVTNNSTTAVTYDQKGGNDWVGTTTYSTSGTPSFTVNVLTKCDKYFTDPISVFNVQVDDATDTDNSGSPFSNINPAKQVGGLTLGKSFNGAVDAQGPVDIYCADKDAATKCSAEFQGDAITTFLTEVPEPGMLALMGLGFGVLGVFSRRRKATVTTA